MKQKNNWYKGKYSILNWPCTSIKLVIQDCEWVATDKTCLFPNFYNCPVETYKSKMADEIQIEIDCNICSSKFWSREASKNICTKCELLCVSCGSPDVISLYQLKVMHWLKLSIKDWAISREVLLNV